VFFPSYSCSPAFDNSDLRAQKADYRAGQVDIQLAFSPVSSQKPYFGYGNQPINASMAPEYTGFSDLILSWKFASFLGDPARSIELTPQSERAKVCGLNADAQDPSGCH
jgi:hypothetical protein